MAKKRGKRKSKQVVNTKANPGGDIKPIIKTPDKGNTASTSSLSEKDTKLLEKAKAIEKDGELDRKEFSELLYEDLHKNIEQKRVELEKQLELEKQERFKNYEKEVKEKNSDIIEQNMSLKKASDEIEEKNAALEKANKAIEQEQKMILDKAEEEALRIIEEAHKEVEERSQTFLKQLEERESKIEDTEDDLETLEMELEAKEKQLATKEKRLKKQEEVYELANPEAVISLESQLKTHKEHLNVVREEYEKVQGDFNKLKILQAKSKGISPEELQDTNERLRERVEELENKCNRYSEYQLTEMSRALDSEKNYLTTIQNQHKEIAERETELSKLNNGMMEYEQLKSQLDLLRTLNEHLRSEINTTKQMLESSVGEICPALTTIDIQQSEKDGDEYHAHQARLANGVNPREATLEGLIHHVKQYAASRSKPLFYSDRDLRAFVAGMASSHITILQGMSGTGKTSLPKIFSEAVMGEVNVVAVESSWRDRNELLGYYNDFSKKFTAKEFTCDLYRAGSERYQDTLYFIVLDEMNLSRVEYYFADFLSILEDKKSNWKIKLIDTDLRQLPTEITVEVLETLNKDKTDQAKELLKLINQLYPNGNLTDDDKVQVTSSDKLRLITYFSNKKFMNESQSRYLVGGPQRLIDGNTVRIPPNVWFVGTANRDESTFEITDKVYDRAQVLNLNTRAVGEHIKDSRAPLYMPYEVLQNLFRKAQNNHANSFRVESNLVLNEIEQTLRSKFRISYGNRIQDQMNTFVPIYVEAGKGTGLSDEELVNEAIDYQLANKVLRKLEYVEMDSGKAKDGAENLRKIFERNKMILAKEFIDGKLEGEE